MCDINGQGCECYKAVMRAYGAMINDVPQHVALEAAQRIYCHHHPKTPQMDANLMVEHWVNQSHVQ